MLFDGILTGLTSAYKAEKASDRAYTEAMYKRAQDYNTHMANTAYQRGVEDLKAAGLNNWLSVGSPASSPSMAPSETVDSGLVSNSALKLLSLQSSYYLKMADMFMKPLTSAVSVAAKAASSGE